MPWADRVERLLYEGETCERRFDFGSGSESESAPTTLVVTSHRVLAFTPERDGANFRQVDRPNVDGVAVTTTGRSTYRWRALKLGLVGIGLLAVSAAVSFDSLLSPASLESAGVDSSTPGTEGITGALAQIETMLAILDALILVGGLVTSAAALAFVGLSLRSRTRRLVLEVAGGDDVAVPIRGGDDGIVTVGELERAIRPDPVDGRPPTNAEFDS
ncbi:hypothetical protein [Halomontanus rarus]|uniref:hypothetical protein n=1 Tax=Halomontanus rarus TaxID=3034020 RepID=UPI0023E77AF8|nr:hypothetical protein [Halovivax sp. TS33]